MNKDIFVSYRRSDESGTTGRIYDYLVREAGISRKRIFLDVDNLMPDTNFVQEINRRIKTCEVFLVIIGKRWLEGEGREGKRQIDNPNDFVRLEVSAALSRSIPLIPILVDGARMPLEPNLPTNIQLLCQQHAIQLRNAHFEQDIRPLIAAIKWHQNRRIPKEPYAASKEPSSSLWQIVRATFLKSLKVIFPTPAEEEADSVLIEGESAPSSSAQGTVPRPSLGPSTKPATSKPRGLRPPIIDQRDIANLGGLFYLAESGDPIYLYEIGTRFEKGHGVKQNLSIARRYYERSSRAGYVKAQRRLEKLPAK